MWNRTDIRDLLEPNTWLLGSFLNSSFPILCPLEERRSGAETLVKLLVVYFTTVVAFCHLMSIRGESLLISRPLFFVRAAATFIILNLYASG